MFDLLIVVFSGLLILVFSGLLILVFTGIERFIRYLFNGLGFLVKFINSIKEFLPEELLWIYDILPMEGDPTRGVGVNKPDHDMPDVGENPPAPAHVTDNTSENPPAPNRESPAHPNIDTPGPHLNSETRGPEQPREGVLPDNGHAAHENNGGDGVDNPVAPQNNRHAAHENGGHGVDNPVGQRDEEYAGENPYLQAFQRFHAVHGGTISPQLQRTLDIMEEHQNQQRALRDAARSRRDSNN